MSELVVTERQGARVDLVLHRVEAMNALSTPMIEALAAAVEGVRKDHTAGVVVIRSGGGRAFVAGADIKEMAAASPEELKAFIARGQALMRAIEELPVPVIAAVEGMALGGGMELALACDFIAASRKAKFGQPEVNLGLIPGFGGTQRLLLRVGRGVVRRLCLAADMVHGDEALRLGLVDYLFEPEQFSAELDTLVSTILEKGPRAVRAAKRVVVTTEREWISAGLLREAEEFVGLFADAEPREGLGAFLEKRPAKFKQ